jgi:hypothetical protein
MQLATKPTTARVSDLDPYAALIDPLATYPALHGLCSSVLADEGRSAQTEAL